VEAAGGYRGRLRTAVALVAAAILLGAFQWAPLFGAAVAMLLLALPPRRPAALLAGVAALAATVAWTASDFLGLVTLAWSLALGGSLAVTVLRLPQWPFLSRALVAVVAALGAMGAALAATGAWEGFDSSMRTFIHAAIVGTFALLVAQVPEAAPPGEMLEAARTAAELQWQLYPAMAALQALAALGLAWWVFVRAAPHDSGWRQLRPLREFRFNDHLVWLLVAGLLLLLLPLGDAAQRAGANVLFFMGGLYTLRGLAVMVFMAGAPSLFTATLGVVTALLLSRYVLPLALLVGIGDTWLDVRRRVPAATGA